ncbi:MAG: hypothetical protein GU356_07380 [Pyrobaculum sp.]|jgi:hypothetical protein|nr:hypothetical protein [Pyrobaculum sp.]
MLLAAGFVPSLVSLSALKSRALRRGVWLREALRRAAEEVLRLAAPVRVLAKAVGYAIARRLGVEVDEEKALALGLQWLNTPKRWRRDLTTP